MTQPGDSTASVTPLFKNHPLAADSAKCKLVYEALCAHNTLVSSIAVDSDTDYEALTVFLKEQTQRLTDALLEILAAPLPLASTA